MSGRLSVTEAAKMLGVRPSRIHERIREGSLAAEKVGNQWNIEVDSLNRVAHHTGPGRPLSAKSAWDLFAVIEGGASAARLSPASRSRARARLRRLIAEIEGLDGVEEAAAVLARALGSRAERVSYAAAPRDLPGLRSDSRIRLSGVSLPESNMAVGDVVEGYVSAAHINDIVGEYLLEPIARSRANVVLHVVPPDVSSPEAPDIAFGEESRWLALAADLAEHDGVREKNEAIRAVTNLRALLDAARTPRSNGA